MSDKKLTGDNNSDSASPGGKITSDHPDGVDVAPPVPVPPESVSDMAIDIAKCTATGGLKALPSKYEGINGYWRSVRSDNLFEVLYLDHKQYRTITQRIIEGNYQILQAFWQEKNLYLNTGARQNLIRVYEGEGTIENADSLLDKAFTQLKTQAGIDKYHKHLNQLRVKKGKDAISEIVDVLLFDGDLTIGKGNTIIAKGVANGLVEDEVRYYLINEELVPRGFSERSEIKDKDFIYNEWRTDEAVERLKKDRPSIEIKVLGSSVHSLLHLGKVLYDFPLRAKNEYINSIAYLPNSVNFIEQSDAKGKVYENIINDERDIDKRFLKVVYRLNSKLPYKLGNNDYRNIQEIIQRTYNNDEFYQLVAEEYWKGHIHIWLEETDPVNSKKLTPNRDFIGFYKFLLEINAKHPLYYNSERFDTPEALIAKTKGNISYWQKVVTMMTNGLLPVWFQGIGKAAQLDEYNKKIQVFFNTEYYNEQDKKLACVQTLINIIDPTTEVPKIVTSVTEIKNLFIEGSKPFSQPVKLSLKNTGFVKVKANLEEPINGIELSSYIFTFNGLESNTQHDLFLNINPIALIKDKIYKFNINIETVFETVKVPVEIKAIFPTNSYRNILIKYAVFIGVIFALSRFIISSFSSNTRWIDNYFIKKLSETEGYTYIFFGTFFFLIIALASVFFISKKVEKI